MPNNLTNQKIDKEIQSTITSKGQVTIPIQVRKFLGIGTNDKIAFVIKPTGKVELVAPAYPNIKSLQGAAGTLTAPLSWQEVERIAHEDKIKTKQQVKKIKK